MTKLPETDPDAERDAWHDAQAFDNHRMWLQERRRLALLDEYFAMSWPIVKQMSDLRLMFTTPWMVVRDGVVVESGERWHDEKAKSLFDSLEQTLRLISSRHRCPDDMPPCPDCQEREAKEN